MIKRLWRLFCGSSERDKIIAQYREEHAYATKRNRVNSYRSLQETRSKVQEAEILVNGLIKDIRK